MTEPHIAHVTNPTPHMMNPTPLAVPNGSVLLLYRVRIWLYKARSVENHNIMSTRVAFGELWTPVRIAGWALARSPVSRLISGISPDLWDPCESRIYLVPLPGFRRPASTTSSAQLGQLRLWVEGTPLALWSTTGIDGWTANRADIVPWCTDLAFSDGPHTRSSREPASVRCGSGARTGPSPT